LVQIEYRPVRATGRGATITSKPIQSSFAVATFLAAASLSAQAADLPAAPVYKAPPPAPSGYNWTGFYVGLNAGGAWGSSAITTTLNPTPNPPNNAAVAAADSPTINSSGFTGGIQAGYNWQTGNFVLGVEADFDYLGLRGSQNAGGAFPVGNPGTFATSNSVQTDWLFTARPRLGVLFNGWLVYGTGGLAVTDPQFNSVKTDTFNQNEAASFATTRVGWTIGGGGEYALGNGWSLKAEYLYADFGSVSVAALQPPANVITFTHNVPLTTNIVRGGINFKF
jgi:outer membrane immunogenic protein